MVELWRPRNRGRDESSRSLSRSADGGVPPSNAISVGRPYQKDSKQHHFSLTIVARRIIHRPWRVLFVIAVCFTAFNQMSWIADNDDDDDVTTASSNIVASSDQKNRVLTDIERVRERLRKKRKARNGALSNNSPRTPLIIVPGAMGSLLTAQLDKPSVVSPLCSKKSDWFTLWITESALLLPRCFFDNVKMVYLGEGKQRPPEGIDVRVPFYGAHVKGVRCLLPHTKTHCQNSKNWYDVLEGLEKAGYVVGEDLFSAPFDFRQGPDDHMTTSYPQLKSLVEYVYRSNGNRKVGLSSISLGSLYLHTFFTQYVDQDWKDQYIERWLSMSGTFNGFGQSFLNTVFGRNQFLGFPVFEQTDVRDAYRTWFSASWLIPKPVKEDRVILETPSRTYRLSDVKDILQDDQRAMYERSLRYNGTADPGVPMDCWYAKITARDTAVSYRIKEEAGKDMYYSTTGVDVEEVYGTGDGAADVESLSMCADWKGTRVRVFYKLCHGCFLRRLPAIEALVDLFAGTNKTVQEGGTQSNRTIEVSDA